MVSEREECEKGLRGNTMIEQLFDLRCILMFCRESRNVLSVEGKHLSKNEIVKRNDEVLSFFFLETEKRLSRNENVKFNDEVVFL